jgi:hypothetical protein
VSEGTGGLRTPPSLKTRRIGLATLIVLVGTTLSVGWHYVAGAYLGLRYPMTSFLFTSTDRFNDLLNTIRDVRVFDAVRGGVTLAYTPLQHAVLYLCIRLTRMLGVGSALLWITMAAFVGLLVYFLIRFFTERSVGLAVNAQRVFILAALSYPVLFVLDRANTEMLVFAAVFGFVFFYYIKPNRWLWIACLAAAICLKIYPGVLILIPLSDRRFRDSTYALIATVVATLVSVWFLGVQSQYGLAGVLQLWKTYLFGANGQGGAHAIWWAGIQHGHSIWGASYLIDVLVGKPFSLAVLQKVYLVFAAIAAVAGAAWTYFGHLRPWQKLTIVTFMYMLLPFSSHDYTLLHVYFPLALFVATEETQRFDRILTVLFALLLVPLDYYYFIQNARFWPVELGQDAGWMMGMSVIVYPLIMLVILALIAFQSRRSNGTADRLPPAGRRPQARHRPRAARHAAPSGTAEEL